MEATLRQHLVTCATAFAAAKSIELSTVARLALGDWRFFDRLGSGASFTVRKYDSAIGWFSENWPDDADWPRDVLRPVRAAEPVA